ncbi:MAG: hypothetical protein ACKPKO_38640, partial [Candidatus Fonsibacter sp.]
IYTLEQECEHLKQAVSSQNDEIINYRHAQNTLPMALQESTQETESLKCKLRTTEAMIAAGPTYTTSSTERDSILRDEISQMKEMEVLWCTELFSAKKELRESSA